MLYRNFIVMGRDCHVGYRPLVELKVKLVLDVLVSQRETCIIQYFSFANPAFCDNNKAMQSLKHIHLVTCEMRNAIDRTGAVSVCSASKNIICSPC